MQVPCVVPAVARLVIARVELLARRATPQRHLRRAVDTQIAGIGDEGLDRAVVDPETFRRSRRGPAGRRPRFRGEVSGGRRRTDRIDCGGQPAFSAISGKNPYYLLPEFAGFAILLALAADARPRLTRMFLHAGSVRLAHPVGGQPLLFEAPLPPECSTFLKGLDVAPV